MDRTNRVDSRQIAYSGVVFLAWLALALVPLRLMRTPGGSFDGVGPEIGALILATVAASMYFVRSAKRVFTNHERLRLIGVFVSTSVVFDMVFYSATRDAFTLSWATFLTTTAVIALLYGAVFISFAVIVIATPLARFFSAGDR